jgi:hypothetical protein
MGTIRENISKRLFKKETGKKGEKHLVKAVDLSTANTLELLEEL